MWLYIISALGNLSGHFIPVLQFFMIVCFVYGAIQFTRIKRINALDGIVLFYFAYAIVNAVLIDYPNHFRFLVQAFVFQVCPLMCYFIARNNELDLEYILKKMLVPLTIVMVIGVYCHLVQPAWYSALKWVSIYEKYGTGYVNDYSVIEQMRLTSIFNSSYYVAFATLFFSVYLLYALSFRALKTRVKLLYISLLVLSVVVMIFANHRATLLGFMIAYLFCFVRGKNKAMRGYLVIGAGVIAVIFITIMFSSEEYASYITARFQSVTTQAGIEDRLEHTGGEQNLLSLFGDGYGHHSLRAREYGSWALIDSQYQKELGELGVFGFILFILMLLITALKAIDKRNDAGLELCIFLFFVEAFIGASALAIDSEYSFIFWYALGKISQKSSERKRNARLAEANIVLAPVKL